MRNTIPAQRQIQLHICFEKSLQAGLRGYCRSAQEILWDTGPEADRKWQMLNLFCYCPQSQYGKLKLSGDRRTK